MSVRCDNMLSYGCLIKNSFCYVRPEVNSNIRKQGIKQKYKQKASVCQLDSVTYLAAFFEKNNFNYIQ